ncbi:MAG: adenosylcobinamide-GDP ribazoletransferase [Clostridia bacterium]|nr:adenosylcobinamide-GDP ribazoletransferase [Clostridia bacterium]MBQ8557132.1 adenosylcobinamide-GDP ribazoletransferase [Clostridia bacterium]
MRVIRSLCIAFSTYSRIPVPQVEWSEENRKYSMCFFPLIGAIIGLLLWGWLWLCDALSIGPVLRGAVGALLPILVTGGIHMDGFMDTSDALASWQTKERRLEILKDTHVGAFAVIGCVGYMLLMAGALSETSAHAGFMLAVCFVVSRSLSAWTLAAFPSARPNGMLDSFARAAHKRLVTVSSGVYLLLCAAVWLIFGGWLGLACLCLTVTWTQYYHHMSIKYFGGVTGDLAGWFVQTAELLLIAVIVFGGAL